MKAIVQSFNSITQKGVLIASVPFLELNKNAIFTHKLNPGKDTTNENIINASEDFYQRELNTPHVNEIKSYIKESILNKSEEIAIFPTSMVLAINIEEDATRQFSINKVIDTEIKSLSDFFYIVDGQHRLFAMKSLYEDVLSSSKSDDIDIRTYIEQFNFTCTILVNFDLWEQSLMFANINFKQKKVNKSLYYDIYGSYYPENKNDYKTNCIYLAHMLVRSLNTLEESPLRGSVKMLGTGKGFISQAFLVENILPLMNSTRSIWYVSSSETKQSDFSVRFMSNELISFLSALKDVFPSSWPKECKHTSILMKTTGFGAFLQIMSDLHTYLPSRMIEQLKQKTTDRINTHYINYIKESYLNKLKPYETSLLSLNGDFSKRSGKASQRDLYKKIREILELDI